MRRSVLVLIAVLTIGLGFSRSAVLATYRPDVEQVDQATLGPGFARHPLFLATRGRDAHGQPLFTSTTPTGYAPAQIQAYLGLTGSGAGQTIAIVDAYDDPSITNDLNTFSSRFGLPLVCGSAGADPASCLTFRKATPQGTPRGNSGWALEIALDVEWAHAVAPKANILLVEALSNSFSNLLGAIDYAAQQGASVISDSWGGSEFGGESSYDAHCKLSAAVCTFSSGDGGNPGGYPAYNPFVISVGGTTLNLTSAGSVVSETAWSGSGGGISQYEAKPAYQTTYKAAAYPFATRGIPDVSYDADPNTGFPVYDSVSYHGQSGWFQVGGTSAGAPQWSAIIAVADQERASAGKGRLTSSALQASSALYALLGNSTLYDIASGTNGGCGDVCSAARGYDLVTGLGSPRLGIDGALSSSP